MKSSPDLKKAFRAAEKAARAAGRLMGRELRQPKRATSATQHDIKLELDVTCQRTIERILTRFDRSISIIGEEESRGNRLAPARWVVDPIDGTVNFAYGIPHACVSIALQVRKGRVYKTVMGIVYDPFTDELFSAIQGDRARLNGKPISVSRRARLDEAIVAMGFSKSKQVLDQMIPKFNKLIYRIRKARVMGAAALSLVYVAAGRMDAYLEKGIRLWDIAAGGFILERAGGEFWNRQIAGDEYYEMIANNGRLRKKLAPYF